MPDLEKVIIGLSKCGRVNRGLEGCAECPYKLKPGHYAGMKCWWRLCDDALALLKEQEPRVMTFEEIMLCSDWVWCEYSSGYQGWYKMEEYDKECCLFRWEDTTTDIVDDYGVKWRCWTSRPTNEQRKAVAWDA